MKTTLVTVLAAAAAASAAAQGSPHFEIEAGFEPAAASRSAAVTVRLVALDPDVEVNQVPAPRLKLDPQQSLLRERPPRPAPVAVAGATDPEAPAYLDLAEPLRFEVELSSQAPAGIHGVNAELVYFYCSKRQGWCRRGSEPLTIPLQVSR